MRDVRLCLLGFGHVARALCALLETQERTLAARHGLRFLVSAVGTRRGSLVAADGLPPDVVLQTIGGRAAPPQAPLPAARLMDAARADVLAELTVMELGGAPAATGHVLAAFDRGMDVVTANKGPIAWNWTRVATAARRSGRRIRFESTVMDGLPVFGLLEHGLPDCRVLGFEAVFNATTNAILDAVAEGRSLDEALVVAEADGLTEADPSYDLDGWDAACKAAALANVAMDARLTPADVERASLADVPAERVLAAHRAGRRVRMVATVAREAPAGRIHARLAAAELDIDHPLAAVSGASLGVLLHTDLMADVFVSERHALLPQTAYGVYADLLHLGRTP